MKLNAVQNRIQYLMAVFVAQIKTAAAMSKTDINKVAETVLIPILSEIYDCQNLENLNTPSSPNFPSIDLGDKVKRIAFQITSTSTIDKIKDTLRRYREHNLYREYDRVIVYILTEKQSSYSEQSILDCTEGKFRFDVKADIQDFTNILAAIATYQRARAERFQRILEENFGDGKAGLFDKAPEPQFETVALNLLPVSFPRDLYVGELLIRTNNTKGWNRRNPRDQVADWLRDRNLAFAGDWICYENQVLTFHDLSDPALPLAQVVDHGTITRICPEEFYGQSVDELSVFKSLLWRCLKQKLYHQRIVWQHEEGLFIFSDIDGEATRKERWVGKKPSDRTVFKRVMKKNQPDEIYFCKHLAFHSRFHLYDNQWYISIRPDWLFTRDGYHSARYFANRIDYIKKNEWNQQVFNHVRFICHILTHDPPATLFADNRPYRFLSCGDIARFDNSLTLDDSDWLQGETQAKQKRLQSTDDLGSLDLDL
jgi:hypothetical protein